MDDGGEAPGGCHGGWMRTLLERPVADDDLLTAASARASGLTPDDLARGVRRGELHRVRRGVYCRAGTWAGAAPAAQHLLRVRAAALALGTPTFSHRSAAAAWGLPVLGAWPADVDVLVHGARGGRSSRGVRRRAAAPGVRVTARAGVVVTDLARTVVDLAATEPFPSGVVATDHALRELGLPPSEAEDLLSARGAAPGVRRAREVLAFADRRSESPGESLSRVRLRELGAPPPVLQHELLDRDGFIGRVDFWWPGQRVVGEFDGRLKYRADEVADGRPAEDRVWAEKLREDRMRAHGVRVVRWTWDDALRADPLRARLAAAGLVPR